MKPNVAAQSLDRERALESAGQSNSDTIYQVARELVERGPRGNTLFDVGCGAGNLFRELKGVIQRYVGIDLVRYDGFPAGAELMQLNLAQAESQLPPEAADTVCCLETIEHVENPRALMRGLVRTLKPGGRLIVSTPNQLSFLSKLGLVLKNEFVHFQEAPGLYPSHVSALLECDLVRMAKENGLHDVEIVYSGEGRMPGTSAHWPAFLSAREGWAGRAFSDNVFLTARKARP